MTFSLVLGNPNHREMMEINRIKMTLSAGITTVFPVDLQRNQKYKKEKSNRAQRASLKESLKVKK